jgi:hypothetical protein
MSYNKDLLAGGGFYPNGNYPLIEAKDVYVDDNTRLDEALQNLLGNYKIEVLSSAPNETDADPNTIYFILGA